ncbi:MAG: hypothetical protein ABSF69_18290 [Polyangiaceae bacterium]
MAAGADGVEIHGANGYLIERGASSPSRRATRFDAARTFSTTSPRPSGTA